jgi:hypothetical protein
VNGILTSNIGYHYSKNPAVTEMLLGVLEHDAKVQMRSIAGEVLARTRNNDPRVRDALAKALASDSGAGGARYDTTDFTAHGTNSAQ